MRLSWVHTLSRDSNSYEDAGYKPSNLVKVPNFVRPLEFSSCHAQMTFLLNGKPVDALALIVHKSAEQEVGRAWVKKLRKPLLASYRCSLHSFS